MAKNPSTVQPPDVREIDFHSFDALLTELNKKSRSHIRLAKVADQGLVEAARQGSAFVMQPRVRVVATVLDHTVPEILRFADKWDVGSGTVTLHEFGGGSHRDPTGRTTRDRMIAAFEARGIAVSEGEWTAASAKAALNH